MIYVLKKRLFKHQRRRRYDCKVSFSGVYERKGGGDAGFLRAAFRRNSDGQLRVVREPRIWQSGLDLAVHGSSTWPKQHRNNTARLMYNFAVDDVDAEYRRLTSEGLAIIVPPEDDPWGNRNFVAQDPNSITLYIYSERKPSEEFRQH